MTNEFITLDVTLLCIVSFLLLMLFIIVILDMPAFSNTGRERMEITETTTIHTSFYTFSQAIRNYFESYNYELKNNPEIQNSF